MGGEPDAGGGSDGGGGDSGGAVARICRDDVLIAVAVPRPGSDCRCPHSEQKASAGITGASQFGHLACSCIGRSSFRESNSGAVEESLRGFGSLLFNVGRNNDAALDCVSAGEVSVCPVCLSRIEFDFHFVSGSREDGK